MIEVKCWCIIVGDQIITDSTILIEIIKQHYDNKIIYCSLPIQTLHYVGFHAVLGHAMPGLGDTGIWGLVGKFLVKNV